MAEDDETGAKRALWGEDWTVHPPVGETEVSLGDRLSFSEVRFFVRREDWQQHAVLGVCELVKLFSSQGREKANRESSVDTAIGSTPGKYNTANRIRIPADELRH